MRDDTSLDTDFKACDLLEPHNTASVLKCDLDKYREELPASEWTEDEQNELMSVVWNIMQSFVRLGLGLDSTSSILGKIAENAAVEAIEDEPPSNRVEAFNTVVSLSEKKEKDN